MPVSTDLANKSIQAAVAAIEIYNKPNFSYREEAFALLMTNAWELLLKAKWTQDRKDMVESLYEMRKDEDGNQVPKTNRSGNELSFSLSYLASKLLDDKNSGLELAAHDNILALVEIRDNAAHFFNKDIYLGRRILEIGTASLRNYLTLATEWFQIDLSVYNFFLMPISFYHGFEAAEPASRAHYPQQIQNLLSFLDRLEEGSGQNADSTQHVALRMETKLVRGKDASSLSFRWTDDPKAPVLSVREEDALKNYPLTYRTLADALKRRYSNFVENRDYHRLRKGFEKEKKYAVVRLLNPESQRSPRQIFYNANIVQAFDAHYERRRKD